MGHVDASVLLDTVDRDGALKERLGGIGWERARKWQFFLFPIPTHVTSPLGRRSVGGHSCCFNAKEVSFPVNKISMLSLVLSLMLKSQSVPLFSSDPNI